MVELKQLGFRRVIAESVYNCSVDENGKEVKTPIVFYRKDILVNKKEIRIWVEENEEGMRVTKSYPLYLCEEDFIRDVPRGAESMNNVLMEIAFQEGRQFQANKLKRAMRV